MGSRPRLQGQAHNQRERSSAQDGRHAGGDVDCSSSLGSRCGGLGCGRGSGHQGGGGGREGGHAGTGSSSDRIHSDQGLGNSRSRLRGGVLGGGNMRRRNAEERGDQGAELHFGFLRE